MTTDDRSEKDQDSGLSFTSSQSMGRTRIREFSRVGCADQRGVVFEDESLETTVGIRLDLPMNAPLRNVSATSTDALVLLGALTRSLQSRNLQAQLISGKHGLEAVLISRHICGGEKRPELTTHVTEISEVIEGIAASVQLRGQEMVDLILDRTALLHAGVLPELKPASAMIVPTFDEAQRDRMMNRS